MNSSYRTRFTKVVVLWCILLVAGCIPELIDETPLAMVNNTPVTYGEFKRELEALHLKSKDGGEKSPMDLEGFIEKLVRRRLFIQEAIRAGLDTDPHIEASVNAELKRQAIIHLHTEEIDNKVSVSDEEAWEEYSASLNTRKEEIEKLGQEFPLDPNQRDQQAIHYVSSLRKRATIEVDPNYVFQGEGKCDPNVPAATVNGTTIPCSSLSQALTDCQEHCAWEHTLQWLIDRELLNQEGVRYTPTRDSFEKAKGRIKRRLLKERQKEREEMYLEELRKTARITMESIDPNALVPGNSDPNRPVAHIDDEPISLGELIAYMESRNEGRNSPEEGNEGIDNGIQYLIDCRLVDREALTRGYEDLPDVQKTIRILRENILYKKFFEKILIPAIKLTDEEIEAYYKEHPDLFSTPVYVKVEEIRVEQEEDAQRIWAELEAGADFDFLSRDPRVQRISGRHWAPVIHYPPAIRERLIQAGEEERFGPVSWEKGHSIFLVKRRRGGNLVPFEMARESVQKRLWNERFNEAIDRWDASLRTSSEIVVYRDRLRAIQSGITGDTVAE
ncbi:MAG: peptidyl-prolyl cis-trans isomerase [bacterium]